MQIGLIFVGAANDAGRARGLTFPSIGPLIFVNATLYNKCKNLYDAIDDRRDQRVLYT